MLVEKGGLSQCASWIRLVAYRSMVCRHNTHPPKKTQPRTAYPKHAAVSQWQGLPYYTNTQTQTHSRTCELQVLDFNHKHIGRDVVAQGLHVFPYCSPEGFTILHHLNPNAIEVCRAAPQHVANRAFCRSRSVSIAHSPAYDGLHEACFCFAGRLDAQDDKHRRPRLRRTPAILPCLSIKGSDSPVLHLSFIQVGWE